ncbi:AAA family ATPase [Candidatus Poribacteria bacterium]|nr:AAA family ATPase [Candidatus Poribacteria bacterium]
MNRDINYIFKSIEPNLKLAISIPDTSLAEEPIGLDILLEHLDARKDKIRITGNERAKGFILIGPPGTGKTMFARIIGRRTGLLTVEFCISSLINTPYGEIENRFSQILSVLEAMSPNVVLIDEFWNFFEDSSKMERRTIVRLSELLLSWFSDNLYPNFIVVTSNNIQRFGDIGLAIIRSGCFDAAFFIDFPSFESRRRMLKRWLSKDNDLADQIAGMTEKFSGADLHSIIKQAMAKHENDELTLNILKHEIELKWLKVINVYDEFQELRRWGRMHCKPAGYFE